MTAEMLKAEETETSHLLMYVFREIWEGKMISEAQRTGLIVKLPKKGDLGDCSYWRDATLLPITSKVMHTRLAEALDEYIRQVFTLDTCALTTFSP